MTKNKNSKVSAQIANLSQLLSSALKVSGPAKQRARKSGKKKRKVKNTMTTLSSGQTLSRFSGSETVMTADGRSVMIYLSPGKSGLPRLDNIASVFERFRIISLRIEAIPVVGSSIGGNAVLCIVTDPSAAPSSMAKALSVQPGITFPLSSPAKLSAPRFIRQDAPLVSTVDGQQKERDHSEGLIFCTTADGKSHPIIRVHYTIEFLGLSPLA